MVDVEVTTGKDTEPVEEGVAARCVVCRSDYLQDGRQVITLCSFDCAQNFEPGEPAV